MNDRVLDWFLARFVWRSTSASKNSHQHMLDGDAMDDAVRILLLYREEHEEATMRTAYYRDAQQRIRSRLGID